MRQRSRGYITILLASSMLVLFGFAIGTMIQDGRAATQPYTLEQAPAPAQISASGAAFAAVYEKVAPSVVAINTYIGQQSVGGASGFVLDTKGHIITNNHVVDELFTRGNLPSNTRGELSYVVEFYNGALAEVEVIGADVVSDLAVLRVNPRVTELQPVIFADSDALTVGQEVLAIGNPYGNEWTLTSGIISALDRVITNELTDYLSGGFIQTDAAINPGNSGGPLLNLKGHVIGVNNSIQLDTSGRRPQPGAPALSNSGVGFAIPSNLVRRVSQELIAYQSVEYSFLGIRRREITLASLDTYELPNSTHGVLVGSTTDGSPARQAGIRAGDLIVAIDEKEIRTFSQLLAYLAVYTRPRDDVLLTVRRGRDLINVSLTLAARPPE